MIKNVVFDIGNVLIDFKPWKWLSTRYNKEDGEFLFSSFIGSPLWIDLDMGSKTPGEVREILISRYPEKEELLADCMDNYYEMLTPIPGGVSLLEKLAEKNYSLYYLSNYHSGAFSHLSRKHNWFNNFLGGIVSAHHKVMKPSPRIYQLLVQNTGIRPDESLFLDDTLENIETAKKMGFKVHHVTSHHMLEAKVEEKLEKGKVL